MRPNLIFSLFSLAGSIVLAILATKIPQYEDWFWVAAGFCVVAAIGVWAEPIVSPWLLAYLAPGPKASSRPSTDAVVYPGLDKTRDNKSACDSKRDVWLTEAVWRAYLGIWHIPDGGLQGLNLQESEKQRFAILVIREFRQLAFEGKLPIWGWRRGYTIWEEVPREFWSDNQIDYIPIATADAPDQITAQADNPWKKPDTSGDWHHFMTSKAVIEQLYPKPQ